MATIKTSGIEIFSKQLETLSKEISNINSMALYDGAGVIADAIGNALKGLPVRGDEEWGSSKWKLYGATESEKQQLAENFGQGTHTVTAAMSKCKSKAEAAMKNRVEKEINELTK